MSGVAIATSPNRQHAPGEPALWLFLLGDMLIYGLFFLFYAHARAQEAELFAASKAVLHPVFGVVNTLLLLTSSWFVAMGVQSLRTARKVAAMRWIGLAIACGLAFTVSKAIEYTLEIDAGIVLTSNAFFMFYYVLTALHLLHVLAGTVVLVFMLRKIDAAPDLVSPIAFVESGACFWHLVDLLWILIFPLLYLIA